MIYLYLGTIVCIIFALVGYFVEKKMWINPMTIFCALWGMILLFSSMEQFTLYIASDEINLTILLGIISFIIGYFFNKIFLGKVRFSFGKNNFFLNNNIKYKTIPRYQLLYLLGLGMPNPFSRNVIPR